MVKEPKPLKDLLLHLLDHVDGKTPDRDWLQYTWFSLPGEYNTIFPHDAPFTSAEVGSICGSTSCIAGETLLFNGYSNPNELGLDNCGWPEAASWLGLDGRMPPTVFNGTTIYSLFSPNLPKEGVKTELKRRLGMLEIQA